METNGDVHDRYGYRHPFVEGRQYVGGIGDSPRTVRIPFRTVKINRIIDYPAL